MAVNPHVAAARIRKWAEAGFSYGQVETMRKALVPDRDESKARAPKVSGRLASTIRVINPSSKASARHGVIRSGISAGSKSRSNPVPYASVLQTGVIGYGFASRAKTKPHEIAAQGAGLFGKGWVRAGGSGRGKASFTPTSGKKAVVLKGSGLVRRSVTHPGSTFRARNFLAIDQPRFGAALEAGIARSWKAEVEA